MPSRRATFLMRMSCWAVNYLLDIKVHNIILEDGFGSHSTHRAGNWTNVLTVTFQGGSTQAL
jgi:hypothetical protein